MLAALRIPVVEMPGYEADDVIATLTDQARAQGMQVLICSGDRDAFQLVNDDVTVLYPKRGVSELSRMDPAAVDARYGVGPEHYRAIAAMVGETSDNLPGVARRGREDRGEVDPGVRRLRRRGRARRPDQGQGGRQPARAPRRDVLRNYELNRLRATTWMLPIAPAETVWHGWDREAVHRVFDTLQFRVLRDRLYEYLEAVEPEAESRLRPGR